MSTTTKQAGITPGPWYAKDGCVASESDASGKTIALVPSEANAHLIAAAPELLDALKRLLKYADWYSDEMTKRGRGAEELGDSASSDSVGGMARRAIMIAEGR